MAILLDKRARILDAATALFGRYGFRKTSVDDIAVEAGVAKSTVYHIYESKEELFYQVVHKQLRDWIAETSRLIDPERPATELLASCTLPAWQYLEGRPLVRDLLLGNHEEVLPLWTDRLEDLRAVGGMNTIEILRIGIRQGVFRADLDVERVGRLLHDMLAAGMLMSYRSRRPPAEAIQASLVGLDLVVNGLVKR